MRLARRWDPGLLDRQWRKAKRVRKAIDRRDSIEDHVPIEDRDPIVDRDSIEDRDLIVDHDPKAPLVLTIEDRDPKALRPVIGRNVSIVDRDSIVDRVLINVDRVPIVDLVPINVDRDLINVDRDPTVVRGRPLRERPMLEEQFRRPNPRHRNKQSRFRRPNLRHLRSPHRRSCRSLRLRRKRVDRALPPPNPHSRPKRRSPPKPKRLKPRHPKQPFVPTNLLKLLPKHRLSTKLTSRPRGMQPSKPHAKLAIAPRRSSTRGLRPRTSKLSRLLPMPKRHRMQRARTHDGRSTCSSLVAWRFRPSRVWRVSIRVPK